VVDEDATHHLGRDAQEMGAVLPDDALLIDEAQVGLVNERGGLERVPRLLPAQEGGGLLPEVETSIGLPETRLCPHQANGRVATESQPNDTLPAISTQANRMASDFS
jgi:hypothetical protein